MTNPRPSLGSIVLACLLGCSSETSSVDTSGSTPAAPAALSIVAGDNQTGNVGLALPTTLSVRAVTSASAGVARVEVRFAVATGGASVFPAVATTDSAGFASTVLTMGSTAGPVAVNAAITGTSITATLHATAIVPDPDSTLAATVYNPDWTEATHGKVSPNYTEVFPQTAVNTIEITMTATQWASIRTDMTSLYGYDFGARPQAGGGFPEDDPNYVAIALKYNGKLWKKAGFRLKGNSTLASAWGSGNWKLPFRLKLNEFEATYPAIKSQRFFGFKELSFSPGRSDPALIREKSTADIFRLAGIPAAQTAFYRVFIDFGTGPRYCGVYTGVEVIDDTMIKNQFGEDKGNIYKPESRFLTFVEAEFEKKNNKTLPDYTDVQAAITALNSPLRASDAAQWRANLEAVFNVDHFLKWLAIDNAIVNWDSYGTMAHNYYLYNHPANRLTWIPWDHNEAMTGSPGITGAGAGGGAGGRTGLSLSMNEVTTGWPLIRFLIDDPVYLAQYKAHLKAFNDGVFSQAAMDALFGGYHALIAPYVTGSNGEQPGATYTSPSAFAAGLPALKTHVQNRKALISSYLP